MTEINLIIASINAVLAVFNYWLSMRALRAARENLRNAQAAAGVKEAGRG